VAAALAGLSQQHQLLKEPSAYTIKQPLYASLNSKVLIAQQTLRITGTSSVKLMELMAVAAAGWLPLGNS